MAAGRKGFEIEVAIEGVAAEKSAKEEYLGGQKKPHAKAVRLGLLLEVVELVRHQGGFMVCFSQREPPQVRRRKPLR